MMLNLFSCDYLPSVYPLLGKCLFTSFVHFLIGVLVSCSQRPPNSKAQDSTPDPGSQKRGSLTQEQYVRTSRSAKAKSQMSSLEVGAPFFLSAPLVELRRIPDQGAENSRVLIIPDPIHELVVLLSGEASRGPEATAHCLTKYSSPWVELSFKETCHCPHPHISRALVQRFLPRGRRGGGSCGLQSLPKGLDFICNTGWTNWSLKNSGCCGERQLGENQDTS